MKLISRSALGPLGSILAPRKDKDRGAGKDTAAPSVPGIGKDVPSSSAPQQGSDVPTPSIPGIAGIESDLPTPSVTELDKGIPTPSATGAAKDTSAPSTPGADSATDGSLQPSTVTTSITVSVTEISTVTSADVTVTIVQHDLATVATTAPTTVTSVQHDLGTAATAVPTATTAMVGPSTQQNAHTTAVPLPAVSAIPTLKKHTEPAVVVSIVFGVVILGLLGIILFLVMKVRRMAKLRPTIGMKTYAEEFNWPQQRAVDMDDLRRNSECGPKQEEAWGVA